MVPPAKMPPTTGDHHVDGGLQDRSRGDVELPFQRQDAAGEVVSHVHR
jgi:hypothetical protein